MKCTVLSITKIVAGRKDLPPQFSELIRPDLVKRAVEASQANARQRYGAKPGAGMRSSSEVSRRRRDYRGSYGHGISRVPRKVLTRRGTQFFWVGAFASGTVGGRRAHPPKSEKVLSKKINVKEKRKAIRSAIASTSIPGLVEKRGHILPPGYPFIAETRLEALATTKNALRALKNFGLEKEIERVAVTKKRAGRGNLRGRKTSQKKGPLLVVAHDCALMKSAANIPGVDTMRVDLLNAEALAPGADIGRLTIFTEAAIDRLAAEKLFMNDYVCPKQEKPKKEENAQPRPAAAKPAAKKEGRKDKEKDKERGIRKDAAPPAKKA